MSNQPKLKVGDTFVYTKEMKDAWKKYESNHYEVHNSDHGSPGNYEIDEVRSCSTCAHHYRTKADGWWIPSMFVDPFLPSQPTSKQPEIWTQKTEYVSKSGFKIEKDKITFPDGKTYTFDQFTKHYNQLRSVYRKLSDLKKIKVFP